MKEQEAADIIIVKYKNILPRMDYVILEETAKSCAIICVEEIINGGYCTFPEYWQKVLDILKSK